MRDLSLRLCEYRFVFGNFSIMNTVFFQQCFVIQLFLSFCFENISDTPGDYVGLAITQSIALTAVLQLGAKQSKQF